MVVGQLVYRIQERQYLTIILQESYHRLVQSGQLLIRLVSAGVVRASAVEHITTAIATLVLGYTVAIRETIHLHHQRSLRIVLRERSRSVLRVSLIRIQIGSLITIGTTCHRLYLLELRQLSQLAQDIHQIRIVELCRRCQQLSQILYGWRYRLDKVFLLLKIATESVGPQHLQRAEQHKQRQAVYKVAHRRHLDVILQRVVVFVHQLTAQLVRIFGRGLPEKRCQVVVVRTLSAALIIDEPGVAIASVRGSQSPLPSENST